MGSFRGHALPGTFLFLMGLYEGTKSILSYILKKQKGTCGLSSKALTQIEIVVGTVIVGMSLIGMAGSLFLPGAPFLTLYKEGHWNQLMAWHHFTMYFFFGLLGVTYILCFTIGSLPFSLIKLMLSNALFVESFVFQIHTHGREMLDIFIHQLLVLASFLAGVVAFMEFLIHNNVLLELLRSSLMLLQGSWFWQIGFVLYPPSGVPKWDLADHDSCMFLAICFCWHYALAYIILGMNYALATWFVKSRCKKLCPSQVKLLKNAEEEQTSEEDM